MHAAIELILPVSVHQLTRKLLTVTLLPELFRELSVELTQMKAELWLLRGFNQAEALACCTVMATIASTADGDVDSRVLTHFQLLQQYLSLSVAIKLCFGVTHSDRM